MSNNDVIYLAGACRTPIASFCGAFVSTPAPVLGSVSAKAAVTRAGVPADRIDEVIAVLPSMKNPTISKLYNSGFYAVESVVDRSEVNLLIPKLKKAGAEDILELAISKIVP